MRLLIVEDEPAIRELIDTGLSSEEVEAIRATGASFTAVTAMVKVWVPIRVLSPIVPV